VPSPESLQVHPTDVAGAALEAQNGQNGASGASGQSAHTQAVESSRTSAAWPIVAGLFVAAIVLWRLAGYGVWDPWELRVADDARRLITDGAFSAPRFELGRFLVSLGFRAFGVHEWAGRLPIACAGLLSAWVAFELGRQYSDSRTGAYSALIAGTTPLLLFNARTMFGAAPDMALSSLLGMCALRAQLPDPRSAANSAARSLTWLVATLTLALVVLATRGALLGVVPPLGAAVAARWLGPPRSPHALIERVTDALLGTALVVAIVLIARDVQRDAGDFSRWIGGASASTNPGTFDAVVEQVFHAFAPWSALLPLAMSRQWTLEPSQRSAEPSTRSAEGTLESACLIWLALAYGAQTLFASRYGRELTFLGIVPLAVLVAKSLREVEREGLRSWGAGIAVLLLLGLILRDYLLFPNGPVQGLPVEGIEVPKEWHPRRALSATLIPFGVCAAFAFAGADDSYKLDWRAPYAFLVRQWRRGLAFKLWLIALGLLLTAAVVFGVLGYAIPRRLHLPSLALKLVRRLVFAPLALAVAALLTQLVVLGVAKLGSYRFVPLFVAAAAWGTYSAQSYLPSLSAQFSARDIYAIYNQLARPDEPLAEYRVGTRAAAYYAKGKVVEVSSVSQLIDHLAPSSTAGATTAAVQRWAAFPNSELADIDHSFRARTGRHLIVVDATSSRATLVAALPVDKRPDQNPLSRAVSSHPPEHLSQAVSVNFDDRIELLGYEWKLPHNGYVGAGESFTLTWYFRTTRKLPSSYRLFVHIDGEGQRIHGDHDPVNGRYPVPLWEPGDVIADEQKIDVPASSHAGDYTIYMGFYSGDTRLPIKHGDNAGEDRARVGVLRIQ